MLVDANLLVYASDVNSRFHRPAREWLLAQLNGNRRLGLPWQSLATFLRIATHPRIPSSPLAPSEAWENVSIWLSASTAWIPQPGPNYPELLGDLIARYDVRGDIVPDAQLAALALEHGLTICSADTDFARFTDVAWENPLA